jgi:hypothetical protein
MKEHTLTLGFLKSENLSPTAKLRHLTDELVINILGVRMKDEWWLDGPYQLPEYNDEEDDDGEDAYDQALYQEERRFYDYIAKI